jgi:hypothetical protein
MMPLQPHTIQAGIMRKAAKYLPYTVQKYKILIIDLAPLAELESITKATYVSKKDATTSIFW